MAFPSSSLNTGGPQVLHRLTKAYLSSLTLSHLVKTTGGCSLILSDMGMTRILEFRGAPKHRDIYHEVVYDFIVHSHLPMKQQADLNHFCNPDA